MNEETSDDEQIEIPTRKRKHVISEKKKEQEKQTKKVKKNLKKPAVQKNTQTTNQSVDADKEDIVEDFQFSSEED